MIFFLNARTEQAGFLGYCENAKSTNFKFGRRKRIPSSEEGKEFQGKSIEKYSIKSQKKNSQIMRKKCPHRSKRPTEYQTDKTRK